MLVFQLTASRRGWHGSRCSPGLLRIFQLTASRRGWRSWSSSKRKEEYFNSQPHEEADDLRSQNATPAGHFNSQPHEEADDLKVITKAKQLAFQLTASRRGWHDRGWNDALEKAFQLTASRRGWRNMQKHYSIRNYFNSQPHEEADDTAIGFRCYRNISTHSLTKRLTAVNEEKMPVEKLFQLTASRRGWRRRYHC